MQVHAARWEAAELLDAEHGIILPGAYTDEPEATSTQPTLFEVA